VTINEGGRLHALTVDVEDWAQSSLDYDLPITERALRNTRRLLELLAEAGVRGTFFVQGLVAERFPALVGEIAAAGHEIGSHGFSHRPLFTIGPQAFAEELRRSVGLLEDLSGQRVLGFRAPDFSITPASLWALDILTEQGMVYDSSIYPARTARYGIAETPRFAHRLPNGLIELPLSTFVFAGRNWPVAGGGYLRLFPYAFTRWAISGIGRQGQPAVVYQHPYELNATELSELELPIPARFKLTQGLNRRFIPGRLNRLLREFRFAPAAEVLGQTEKVIQ
jgi:polysaccharide deacetylase family protein (PEP-CTERM system associated)